MDMPISRASAYLKRNRTTHSWYGDWSASNELMSRSCPTARTLEEHMRNARASHSRDRMSSSLHRPRGSSGSDSSASSVPAGMPSGRRDRGSAGYVPSSSASSPGPTTSIKISRGSRGASSMDRSRPSSAYSYDGGFFVTANNQNKDFFVIDPEWVSEMEGVGKLPDAGGKGVVGGRSKPPRVITWKSYRRSKSAPPPKHKNPITWQE